MRKSVIVREERLTRAWGALPEAAQLETVDGEPVRVVYPGRRNAGPGPDFLDAVLETGEGEVRGAVEVHRRTSDWERHGHGADPAYRAVVLHVVGTHDGAASRPAGGTQLRLLELDAGEGAGEDALRHFPCAGTSEADLELARAGDARFGASVARLAAALSGAADAEQLAYVEIAAALGYACNSAPLQELATAFELERVRAFAGCHPGPGPLRSSAFGARIHPGAPPGRRRAAAVAAPSADPPAA